MRVGRELGIMRGIMGMGGEWGEWGEWGEGGEVPFLEWRGVVGIGGEKRKLRRNLMRRGQM